jgi:hypothetical protein
VGRPAVVPDGGRVAGGSAVPAVTGVGRA